MIREGVRNRRRETNNRKEWKIEHGKQLQGVEATCIEEIRISLGVSCSLDEDLVDKLEGDIEKLRSLSGEVLK